MDELDQVRQSARRAWSAGDFSRFAASLWESGGDLVRRLGLSNHVRITGWISGDEVRREILAARGLVLASFAEGLPVVIMCQQVLQDTQ